MTVTYRKRILTYPELFVTSDDLIEVEVTSDIEKLIDQLDAEHSSQIQGDEVYLLEGQSKGVFEAVIVLWPEYTVNGVPAVEVEDASELIVEL